MKKTLILLILISYSAFAQQSQNAEIENAVLKFKEILNIAAKNYVDTLDIRKVSEDAFRAMLQSMDKESLYYDTTSNKSWKETRSGLSIGIGIYLMTFRDSVYVYNIEKGSPAEKLDIKTGDKLLFINGENTYKLNENEANEKLKGDTNTKLNIILKRGTEGKLIEVNAIRKQFEVSSVRSAVYLGEYESVYIKMNRFSNKSYDEFSSAMKELEKYKYKRIIIDLRGNLGGELNEVIKISELFLKKNQVIVSSKVNNERFKFHKIATQDGKYKDFPIIVLIDKSSASASEIFAGIIQDYDKGIIVGEDSYGKGSAQYTWDFKDGSSFRLTVAKYLTPSGRSIDRKNKKNINEIDLMDLKLKLGEKEAKRVAEELQRFSGLSPEDIKMSPKGKVLIGSRGIIPNIAKSADTITLLTQVLNSKRIIYDYVFDFLNRNETTLKTLYKDDYLRFYEEYELSDEEMEIMHKFSLLQNTWNIQMYETDKEYIKNLIKSRIAEAIWGADAYYYGGIYIDGVLKEALKAIPQADAIVK